MKSVSFLGDSLKRLREFPEDAKQDAGYQLDKIQNGLQPDDFKPMPTIGKGVKELRIWDDSGTYRVIYTARLQEIIYVLHAFQKKTSATSKKDIDIAKTRWIDLTRSKK
ncbi:type II toxin-antitoxin system RelE/ParE family toxin [Zwartia vadi]|uniref:type II toxin-antitoxin system RelE/ParE family toxin n=1 Tax=Zwartia vadi TaxID=3058168 RepID=UPI0025B5AEEA|nr:type II toxin-antitoxin system RelE/ParE family toxin [Zwartia vadi]MDN3987954.1 type II toxin-antitoxin system RelE/ParE family toxin [Zwartia vadi]